MIARLLTLLMLLVALGGCGAFPKPLKNLAKSDVDMVSDLHIQRLQAHQRDLLVKLYKRNPRELAKAPAHSIESRLAQLYEQSPAARFPELEYRSGTEAVQLAFEPEFGGDRVFALMAGMKGMLAAAYGFHQEVFLLDELDQQKLYDSARNLEAIAWRLRNSLDSDGQPFLLSNGYDDQGVANLSFERLFGKMIALQDMMSAIVADRTQRTVNSVVQGFASSALIPIGI